MRPLSRDELRSAADVSGTDAFSIWQGALSRGSPDPLLISLLKDWSEFSGMDYEVMLGAMSHAQEKVDKEWEEINPESSEELADFYDKTDTLIPLMIWWHGTTLRPARCAASSASVFRKVGVRRVLDFGCGIGSAALVLARDGIDVVLADVAREPLRFAEWRMRVRGFEASTLDLFSKTLETLTRGSVEGVVAFDVFEHLPDAIPTVEVIDGLLVASGIICFNQIYIPQEDVTEHYPRQGEVLFWLHDHGYRLVHLTDVCWVGQKAALSGPGRAAQALNLRARIGAAKFSERLPGRFGRFVAANTLRLTAR